MPATISYPTISIGCCSNLVADVKGDEIYKTCRFARLLSNDLRQLVGVVLEILGQLDQQGLAFGDRGQGPGLKSFLCGGDSIFEILGRGNRAGPEWFLGSRVRHLMRLLGATQLVIDDIVELKLHFEVI